MARKCREVEDGGLYHIFNKVNEEKFLLEDDFVKEMFLQVVDEAKFKKKYRFIVYGMTIMSNHVHMAVRIQRGQSLAKIMQWIFSVFAMRYNRKFNRKGHFWIDRFKSVLLKTYEAFKNVMEYIKNNPVKAGLVKFAEDFAYGLIGLLRNERYKRIFSPVEI